MSEQRFWFVIDKGKLEYVQDNVTGEKITVTELEDLVNEQQATLQKQEEEIKKLKKTERSWRKIHCCNKESNNCGIVIEQQATINELKEAIDYLKTVIRYTIPNEMVADVFKQIGEEYE